MASKDQLFERDTALAELDRHRRATARGGGRVVLLRGEAGVGKAAVINRFVELRGSNPYPRRRATIADPHGLTERERDVIELLVAGHSDAEIAKALFISPKTANRHVGAILTKLGVRNRTQAAAAYVSGSAHERKR